MYNIPIDRVCVFNCEAIGVINDAVGGVEVTIENDLQMRVEKFSNRSSTRVTH